MFRYVCAQGKVQRSVLRCKRYFVSCCNAIAQAVSATMTWLAGKKSDNSFPQQEACLIRSGCVWPVVAGVVQAWHECRADCLVQDDKKFTQPILKYLLMVAIQYNSIGLIDTDRCDYTRALAVTSCCNLLAPVRQLSFNSRSARMSFSQVQRVFIAEHYLASRSYSFCQNEFRDTFSDSPVPNKSTVSHLVNRFQSLQKILHRVLWDEEKSECMHRRTRWKFPTLNRTCVRNGLRDFFVILCF
jgi:hypothetical protein